MHSRLAVHWSCSDLAPRSAPWRSREPELLYVGTTRGSAKAGLARRGGRGRAPQDGDQRADLLSLATANSFIALGPLGRHGPRKGKSLTTPTNTMTQQEATRLIEGLVHE